MVDSADSKEVVLTYETLYEVLRREKSKEELQKLDKNFFSDVLTYLREKQKAYDESLSKNDVFSIDEREKLRIQLSNIKRILKDLYDIRERKIIALSVNRSRINSDVVNTTNLLDEERALFDGLVAVLQVHRKGIINKILDLRKPDISLVQDKPKPKDTNKKIKRVKFLDKIEQFVGKELELYGPFDKDDEAKLPSEIADILIKQGKAVDV
ncbi:hypothetical protein DRJ22_04050 [Candidatus Woesearchaeota archaeon]|nr:MAG: hypothetical protein B6U93_03410 [Candidatus Woesearchaeota archaeon ex4484_78]RLE45580.1 MAG: hypothetical protein DRJ22_04050 [Candidatus Woesearchaeota archaeon]